MNKARNNLFPYQYSENVSGQRWRVQCQRKIKLYICKTKATVHFFTTGTVALTVFIAPGDVMFLLITVSITINAIITNSGIMFKLLICGYVKSTAHLHKRGPLSGGLDNNSNSYMYMQWNL